MASNDFLYAGLHPISGVTTYLPSYSGEIDWTFNRKDSTFLIPFADGGANSYGPFTAFDAEIRRIAVTFEVPFGQTLPGGANYANATAANDAMSKLFGHGLPMWLTFQMGDGTFRYWYAREVSREYTPTNQTPTWAKYRFQFVSDEPFLTGIVPVGGPVKWDDVSIAWDAVGDNWDSATNLWNFTIASPTVHTAPVYSQQRTVNNIGSVATRDIQLSVYAVGGALNGPITIYNDSIPYLNGNAMYVSFNLNLAAGQAALIDIGQVSANYTGGSLNSVLSFGSANGQDEWFRLEPGNNLLQIVCADSIAPNALWAVIYTPKWR